MSAMGVIELDMNRIELDENGVKNFCWPVELREFFSMRDVVAAGLVQVGRRANSKNTEVAGAFSVILHYFLLEAITAFVNYLLARRAKNGNLKINPSNYSFIVSSFVENRTPDIPKLDVPAWLRQGPSPLSTLRAPIRFVRDLVVSNGIVRRKFIGPSFQKDIISTNVQPMAEAHAQAIAETVTFRRLNLWFGEMKKNDSISSSAEKAASALADEAMEVIEESFRAGNLDLPDFIAKYLNSICMEKPREIMLFQSISSNTFFLSPSTLAIIFVNPTSPSLTMTASAPGKSFVKNLYCSFGSLSMQGPPKIIITSLPNIFLKRSTTY